MIIINGYKLPGTDLAQLNEVLQQARRRVQMAVTEEYHRLLSQEITQMVDDIAMNYVPRPQVSILQAAQNALMEKLRYAGRGFAVEYNLEAPVLILSDGLNIYLLLQTTNPGITEAFSSLEELVWFGIREESEGGDPLNVQTWESLRKQYGADLSQTAMSVHLSGPVKLDTALLTFPSPGSRARERARYTQMNRLLSIYACGKNVPPHSLMPTLDQVLLALLSDENQAEIQETTGRLAAVLPAITTELIQQDPGRSSND